MLCMYVKTVDEVAKCGWRGQVDSPMCGLQAAQVQSVHMMELIEFSSYNGENTPPQKWLSQKLSLVQNKIISSVGSKEL